MRDLGTNLVTQVSASLTGEQAGRLRSELSRALKLSVGNLLFEVVK